MTVTINLPPEKAAALRAKAQAKGLSMDQWLLDLAERASGEPTPVNQNLVDVCAMVKGLADDPDFRRGLTLNRGI